LYCTKLLYHDFHFSASDEEVLQRPSNVNETSVGDDCGRDGVQQHGDQDEAYSPLPKNFLSATVRPDPSVGDSKLPLSENFGREAACKTLANLLCDPVSADLRSFDDDGDDEIVAHPRLSLSSIVIKSASSPEPVPDVLAKDGGRFSLRLRGTTWGTRRAVVGLLGGGERTSGSMGNSPQPGASADLGSSGWGPTPSSSSAAWGNAALPSSQASSQPGICFN